MITHKQQKRAIASVQPLGGAATNCAPCWPPLNTSTGYDCLERWQNYSVTGKKKPQE
ncbi:hypothetical protein D0436_24155 [Shewanella decolorationis]|uniref:Uncharacterized protein n=1 Tax=Shewanella decolorationis TaxID=256839 RepID=A0A8F3E0L1_9GAMM|nr:hypothetical protein [Shewanella decolorationis]QWY79173.1 hypothetical protein D0436_24155 [Shewanella decolorationis]